MKYNFISMRSYDDPVALIDELCLNADGWSELTEDQRSDLRATVDYEPFKFYVVNDEIVLLVDVIDGSVMEKYALADFIKTSLDYIKEGWEDQ